MFQGAVCQEAAVTGSDQALTDTALTDTTTPLELLQRSAGAMRVD
jgi:hypothetical protein